MAFAVLAILTTVASAQVQDAPKVHVESLSITNGPNGITTIKVSIELPKKYIVGIDHLASRVKVFKDDKGTDLTKSPFPDSWNLFLPGRVRDGKATGLDFSANRRAAKGAIKIRVQADVALIYGTEVKHVNVKDIRVNKSDSSVPVGPFSLHWLKPPIPPYIANNVTLYWTDKNNDIAITSASVTGTGSAPQNSSVRLKAIGESEYVPRYDAFFRSDEPTGPPFTVQVSYCDKLERVTVPVDVEVGLGL